MFCGNEPSPFLWMMKSDVHSSPCRAITWFGSHERANMNIEMFCTVSSVHSCASDHTCIRITLMKQCKQNPDLKWCDTLCDAEQPSPQSGKNEPQCRYEAPAWACVGSHGEQRDVAQDLALLTLLHLGGGGGGGV